MATPQGVGTAGAPPLPALLKVPDVAQQFQVSERQIWRLISRGELESVLVGASRRIPRDACESYLARIRKVS